MGSFEPPRRWVTAVGYRIGAGLVGLCGAVLVLAGVTDL